MDLTHFPTWGAEFTPSKEKPQEIYLKIRHILVENQAIADYDLLLGYLNRFWKALPDERLELKRYTELVIKQITQLSTLDSFDKATLVAKCAAILSPKDQIEAESTWNTMKTSFEMKDHAKRDIRQRMDAIAKIEYVKKSNLENIIFF